MSKKHDKGPNAADVLFKNLFSEGLPDEPFEVIAAGIAASRCNAERLLSDVRYLVEAGRLSSARFLLTTAREEIAKSYILADTCRLDLEKHSSVLRGLCRAFYDHISKHAYLEVLAFPNIKSMSDAKVIWEIEVKRWWRAEYETGEPDMPHDTYFDREFPLYIDYDDYGRCWVTPMDVVQNAYLPGDTWRNTRFQDGEATRIMAGGGLNRHVFWNCFNYSKFCLQETLHWRKRHAKAVGKSLRASCGGCNGWD